MNKIKRLQVKANKYLYHATYKRHLDSIKENGLGGKVNQKAWEFSNDGVVCLAHNEDEAESYAETADITEEDETLLDEIVVLEIDTNKLDKDLLFSDSNIKSDEDGLLDDGSTAPLEYHGIIPFDSVIRVIDKSF
jgi:hypothetical protein